MKKKYNIIDFNNWKSGENNKDGSVGTQDRKFNGKFGVARGGCKSSNVLRGRGSRFKASANSRVSLANSMEEVAKLISSNLSKMLEHEL
ncbi:hypothetical protein PVK06_030801 [Gossypium arboreum]|uniref:Uncharacterized protein n=1 Tax=Gossypium arboreum TaxID=29729 RepID=A0ABR0NPI5_GOSAR|nr:hypothetical protein PVK06_030801 [Gossypium arboreum]